MVEKCGIALLMLPNKRKTPKLCLTAVKQIACALEYVPDNFKSKEICTIAFENGLKYSNNPEKYLPSRCITRNTNFTIITNTTEDCPICMDNEGEWCKLECKHKFHLKCINDVFKTRKNCPFCNAEIKINVSINLDEI